MVIEHNLDVIAAADWLVDLGPEGGAGGGLIVAEGTPAQVIATPASHTGKALADYADQPRACRPRRWWPSRRRAIGWPDNAITIRHARHHNLKTSASTFRGINSRSSPGFRLGKSTLAFDIVFGEGQRRYLESLNAYARQFAQPSARPDVDAIFGIPPTVAIEQRVSRGGARARWARSPRSSPSCA